jgi:hypothetical protein
VVHLLQRLIHPDPSNIGSSQAEVPGKCALGDTHIGVGRRRWRTFLAEMRHLLPNGREAETVFFQRFYDVADYRIGWCWNLYPFPIGKVFTILRVKTSKIMETDKYMTVVCIFGRDFIK